MAEQSEELLRYRLDEIAEHLADINEHGTKPMLALRVQIEDLQRDVREMIEGGTHLSRDLRVKIDGICSDMDTLRPLVQKVALIDQKQTDNTHAFEQFRTALYGLAGTILTSAVLLLIFGGHH